MTDGGRQMIRKLFVCALTLAAVTPIAAQKPAARPAQTSAQAPAASIGLTRDAALAAALADISPLRIRQTDSVLVSFRTRNTMSDTTSDSHGIGAARRH